MIGLLYRGDRDTKPRVVLVDGTLVSLQPAEILATPVALRARQKHLKGECRVRGKHRVDKGSF